MRLATWLVALLVPVRVIKVVAAWCAPPGGMSDPAITGVPDTWRPPAWVSNAELADDHPNKR